jgi:TPR repeat protein
MKQAFCAVLLFAATAPVAFAADITKLPPREKRWALVVGVDQYEDSQLNLTGAAKDARSLRDALIETAGFPPEQVILLATGEPHDRLPTEGKILGRLSRLLTKLVPRDGLFLFAFSGHGIERNGHVYLYPSDVENTDDVSVLQETAISVDWIREKVEGNRISQVLFLLDSCRNDPSGRANTPNRMTEAYVNSFRFDTRNERVRAFATLFASAVNERAYEYKEKNQGYFTWAVVEGLRGAAANDQGEVTLSSLVKYVEETVPLRVARDLGFDQQPYTKYEGYRAQDLILSIVPRKDVPPEAAVRDEVDSKAIELRFWESVEKLGTTEAYAEYLRRYPDGIYANLARMRMKPRASGYSRVAADEAYDAGDYAKARTILEKGVAVGEADAQARLGRLLFFCLGGACDFDRARQLFSDAARQGSREGDLWLAAMEVLYGGNPVRAVAVARTAADAGDLLGRYVLERAYVLGRGVQRDEAAARRLCELALPALRARVELRDPWAESWLGRVYEVGGCGLSADPIRAAALYRQASGRGYAMATVYVAGMYFDGDGGVAKNEKKALELYRQAAQQGHPVGLASVGWMYLHGRGGLPKDPIKAAEFYRRASAQDVDATVDLADLYKVGNGTLPKDEHKAADLYRSAVNAGSATARNSLGRMYIRGGGGLPKDAVKAVELFRQSAEEGDATGQTLLAYAYETGQGVAKDEMQAVEWYKRAVEQNNASAQNNLAAMYEKGEGGLQKDLAKAAELYRLAAYQEHALATNNLGRMYELGQGVETDFEKAVGYYRKAAALGNTAAKDNLARLGR